MPGTIIIDTSSSSPFDTTALGKELSTHNLQLVDSPITQTYMHATDFGESTLMVGCDDPDTYTKISPILKTMGKNQKPPRSPPSPLSLTPSLPATYVFPTGRLSTGHATKTLNNYIMASSICALSDSLITAQNYGISPQTLLNVLNVGTGVCFPTLDTFRRDGLTGRYNSGFGLGLLVKDLGICEEFMQHNNFETELPGLARKYLKEALEATGEPGCDHTKALVGWEKRAGKKLQRTERVEEIPKEDFEHRLRGLNRSADI